MDDPAPTSPDQPSPAGRLHDRLRDELAGAARQQPTALHADITWGRHWRRDSDSGDPDNPDEPDEIDQLLTPH